MEMIPIIKWRAVAALLICLTLSAGFIAVYRLDHSRVDVIHGPYRIDPEAMAYSIDHVTRDNQTLFISGWAFAKDSLRPYHNWVSGKGTAVYIHSQVVLRDSHGTLYGLPTSSVSRPDVTAMMNNGSNYDPSGILAQVRLSRLKAGASYQIGVMITDEDGSRTLALSDQTVEG